ncbi:Pheromone a factor receptor [Hyphodiscus hymeniophilus]|uniref:Pheromone a factor receptor n=1 Tax=Hyphodiscus hymeniophilus TaxID=353542 RepID=A0A9P7B0L8_9HELO|nr:Pheromone a factor receptor [Hyphodiscus hymeniophilus]
MDATLPPVAYPLTANAVLVAVFAFFGLVLNIIPLTMLWQVRSLPAVTLIGTVMVYVTWTFINVCIWPRDDFAVWWNGVGLCDIIATLRTPMFSLLALAVCILTRDLSRAVDVDHPRLFESAAQRRRRIITDVLCIFGLPTLQVPLHYLVQYNRFSIIAIYGCVDLLDDSWPKIVLLSMWPLLIGFLNCYYSILTMLRLRRHHGRLSSTLSRTSSGLDAGKFLKLFTMTVVLLIIYLPVLGYFFYTNVRGGFGPYSYSRIHNPMIWNQIIYFHTADYPETQYWAWFPITFAYILFFWYGLTYEAIECYRRTLAFCGFAKIWPSLNHPHQSKSSSYTMSTDPDSITPLPPIGNSAEKHPMPIVQETVVPEPATQLPPVHRGLFSTFRTHINVPFPLFNPMLTPSSAKTTNISPARRASTNTADLEKQAHTEDTTQQAIVTSSPVQTNIWSGTDDEELDPNVPKMGTRAYRERERREMMKRGSQEKNDISRVIPDNVYVNMGHSVQSGVEVKREFVQKEADA